VAAIIKKAGGEYIYAANIPDCWPMPDTALVAPTHRSIFGDELGSRVEKATARAVETDDVVTLELTHMASDRRFEFAIERIVLDGVYYLLVTISERTEEYRREQRLRALLRELNHRTKNLLAIVQSIAAQTARGTLSLPAFLARFNGRVYSLARSQDLVVDTSWTGAKLHDLIRAQAGKYIEQPSEHLRISGDDPMLNPNEALHIGLAIHELFVDAIAVAESLESIPRIEVECHRSLEDGPHVSIVWRQKNILPEGREPAILERDTFGSSVLTRITPAAIGGEAEYSDDGIEIRYSLRFPQRADGEARAD
jgi:two-component sensor histidine kinase